MVLAALERIPFPKDFIEKEPDEITLDLETLIQKNVEY